MVTYRVQDKEPADNKRNYGGNANTISMNQKIPLKEAKKIYDNYMKGFSGLKAYQDWRRQDWQIKGYIDLNPIFGYKAFIHDYNYVMNSDDKFTRKRIGDICRSSINYPIQHTGALCSMVAQIIFFNTLRKKNWLFKVLMTVCPYDEGNCEAPIEIADEVAQLLYDCMIKAGQYFCKRCKLDADIAKDENGELPTYWIH